MFIAQQGLLNKAVPLKPRVKRDQRKAHTKFQLQQTKFDRFLTNQSHPLVGSNPPCRWLPVNPNKSASRGTCTDVHVD